MLTSGGVVQFEGYSLIVKTHLFQFYINLQWIYIW